MVLASQTTSLGKMSEEKIYSEISRESLTEPELSEFSETQHSDQEEE